MKGSSGSMYLEERMYPINKERYRSVGRGEVARQGLRAER